jgi:hypothetical protein
MAGAGTVTLSTLDSKFTLGISTPLLAALISSLALECGVLVPIPTFWALRFFTEIRKKRKKENLFMP